VIKVESADKPGFVMSNHLSRMNVAIHLKQPTLIRCEQHHGICIWSCFQRGLPCHDYY